MQVKCLKRKHSLLVFLDEHLLKSADLTGNQGRCGRNHPSDLRAIDANQQRHHVCLSRSQWPCICQHGDCWKLTRGWYIAWCKCCTDLNTLNRVQCAFLCILFDINPLFYDAINLIQFDVAVDVIVLPTKFLAKELRVCIDRVRDPCVWIFFIIT